MKCNIEYIGEKENGIPEYYCTTHKYLASDETGNKLEECLSPDKELFDNILDIKKTNIKSLKIIYTNILEDKKPEIIINNEEFNGVLTYETSTLTYKDFGGLMLSRINYLSTKDIICKHCHHYHSDNGKFGYTPHRTHQCHYCGRLFRDESKSVGNELTLMFQIPYIHLEEKTLTVNDKCSVEYNLLDGTILVNSNNIDNIIYNGEEISLKEFLNNMLENEY